MLNCKQIYTAGGKYNWLKSVHLETKFTSYYIVYAVNLIFMKPNSLELSPL
jgi:hypothetical protein